MYLIGLRYRLRKEGDDPGAVLELVAQMAVAVVHGVLRPHFPEDLEPAHCEATEGGGVAVSLSSFLLVVRLGPWRFNPAAVGPQVNGGAQDHVAGPADDDDSAAAGLFGDRRGAAVALQRLGVLEDFAIRAQFGQEARGDLFAGAGEGAEEVVVGMLAEQFIDAGAVLVQLRFERAKLLGAGDGQQALGRSDGGIGAGGFRATLNNSMRFAAVSGR